MPVRIGILRIVAVREEGNRNRQAALALHLHPKAPLADA